MMYTISSHAEKNRMTSSAVAACMAPLLLRPLVAGECDLEDDFDVNTDDSLQLLAAATAANSAQAIITSLLEGYEKIFNVDVQIRCSPSADSRTANSIRDDSSDNEILALKNNGHVNNEKGDDQEDEDPDHALSGKLSESSGYGFGVDESDVQSPRDIQGSKESLRLPIDSLLVKDSNVQHVDLQFKQKKGKETSISGMEVYDVLPSSESYLTMGQLFSSMDPEISLPASFPESSIEKLTSKFTGSAPNTSRSTFWVRGKTRKKPASSSADSSGEDEHALRRLETTKKELQFRIAMEARGNEILQASLERRKEALHERRFALEQDISRLQEQLQAERDLRAALEVGLSMSSGQFSNSLGMESEVCSRSRKTSAELEEIALAEADVAGLKQKVAELHYQLNQQRKHQLGSLSDLNDPCEHVSSCSSVRKNLLHDFDSALAFLDHERRRRNGEGLLVADCSDTRRTPAGSKNRQKSQNQQKAFSGDFKNTEVSMDDLDEDSATIPTTSRETNMMDHPLHPSAASSALIELTTRLDFFKERRSQLIDKLHNLDMNYTSSSRDFLHRSSSPSWN